MPNNWYLHKANKYGAKKTVFNERKYDSKLEAGLAQDLELLKKAGEIKEIRPQVTFRLYGKNGTGICSHRVDFLVTNHDGTQWVAEAKGFATNEWRLKRNLFVDNYPEIEYHVYHSQGIKKFKGKK